MRSFEDPVLLMPQVDCDMAIGRDLYTFYFPIEIGDFVITLWSRQPASAKFSVVVFENGNKITPKDRRFSPSLCPWSAKLFKSWAEEVFTRKEVDEIIMDIMKIASQTEAEEGLY